MMSAASPFGVLLRSCRRTRGQSQLQLALLADVSTRHLSFLETGRARPSVALINRLAGALALGEATADALRLAAGYAPNGRAGSLADAVFDTSLALAGAATPERLVDLAEPMLEKLGVRYFFFATAIPVSTADIELNWLEPGIFPRSWRRRYAEQSYAASDPLVRIARDAARGFSWDEKITRSGIGDRAIRMFREAAARGVTRGFVVPQHGPDGALQILSMMSSGEAPTPQAALSLQLLGAELLARFATLRSLPVR